MANLQPNSKKYLLFSMSESETGVDNAFSMLNRVLLEAQHLNRITAIGKFAMSPTHNLGDNRFNWCFADYLDLSNGVPHRLGKEGHSPIAFSVDWIKEQELDLANYAFDQVYNLADDEVVNEEMNQRYDVLIRRDPTLRYASACKEYKYDDCFIDFPYSEKINRLVDQTLDSLGISREAAIAAQHYFLNKVNSSRWDVRHDCIALNQVYYACMHVRMSDRESQWPVFGFSSSKKSIKSVLEHSIAKGSRLYIMSDIHQPDFFDFLKSDYQVYRYHDFPKLRQLVSGENGEKVDNVMLYLVEKNIMKHAMVKILPPHKGPMVYHLNTVYNLSILKKTPVLQVGAFKRAVYNFIRRLLSRIFSR